MKITTTRYAVGCVCSAGQVLYYPGDADDVGDATLFKSRSEALAAIAQSAAPWCIEAVRDRARLQVVKLEIGQAFDED